MCLEIVHSFSPQSFRHWFSTHHCSYLLIIHALIHSTIPSEKPELGGRFNVKTKLWGKAAHIFVQANTHNEFTTDWNIYVRLRPSLLQLACSFTRDFFQSLEILLSIRYNVTLLHLYVNKLFSFLRTRNMHAHIILLRPLTIRRVEWCEEFKGS